jgi:hypothetical protein
MENAPCNRGEDGEEARRREDAGAVRGRCRGGCRVRAARELPAAPPPRRRGSPCRGRW